MSNAYYPMKLIDFYMKYNKKKKEKDISLPFFYDYVINKAKNIENLLVGQN
jgi:hypothetical protein